MESAIATALEALAELADFTTGAAIGVGIVAAMWAAARFLGTRRGGAPSSLPEIRLTLGRWLALALEFALAADILRTVMVPTWNEIGKLAAIVVLRTALNYFLGREIEQRHSVEEMAYPKAA